MDLLVSQCFWVETYLSSSPGTTPDLALSALQWLYGHAHKKTPFALSLFRSLQRNSSALVFEASGTILSHSSLQNPSSGNPVAKFNLRHFSSVRAVRGMMEILGWPQSSLLIGYSGQVSEQKARSLFPLAHVERDLKPTVGDMPHFDFIDGAEFEPVIGIAENKWEVPLVYFKGVIGPLDPLTVEKRRKEWGIGNRLVIVIGSPAELSEVERPLKAIERLPEHERPLVIVALAPENGLEKMKKMLSGRRYVVREKEGDEFPNLSKVDVMAVTTSGELLELYAAGDLSIVGTDRNVVEPASQGKPIFLFNSQRWINNNETRERLIEKGGARVFDENALVDALRNVSVRTQMGLNAKIASDEIRAIAKQRATEFSVFYAFVQTLKNRGTTPTAKWAPHAHLSLSSPFLSDGRDSPAHPKSRVSGGGGMRAMLLALAILPCLALVPEMAEAAVSGGQLVNRGSILGFLVALLAFVIAQFVSLAKLNNAPPPITDDPLRRSVSSPVGNDPTSKEARVELEIRKAFERFARSVGMDPHSARFAPLHALPEEPNHFTQVIFMGQKRFMGQAVIGEKERVRASILLPPKANEDSTEDARPVSAPFALGQTPPVAVFDTGARFEENNDSLTPMGVLMHSTFQGYAEKNNLDMKIAKISKTRSVAENQLSMAVYVGAKRFIVEALRHGSFEEGKIKSVTDVTIFDGNDVLYTKWMSRRLEKEQAERKQVRRPAPLRSVGSLLRPNNLYFLMTGKGAVAGWVVDALFLLAMGASGAALWVLLPSFALFHVALEGRRPLHEGVFGFIAHLAFFLPYALPDFAGGVFQAGNMFWAAIAVGIHGAYDQWTVGLADGEKMARLTRGTVSDQIQVLFGSPLAVTDALDGGLISTTPDFLKRVSKPNPGGLYRLGFRRGFLPRHGALVAEVGSGNPPASRTDMPDQMKFLSPLVPVVEKPVSTEMDLKDLVDLATRVARLNADSPERRQFLTVTPMGEMTEGKVAQALAEANVPPRFVYVKKLSGPVTFEAFGKEFEAALSHFDVRPERMFLVLAGRPAISDIDEVSRQGVPQDALRQRLLPILLGSMPVLASPVILDLLGAMALAEKSA